MRFDDQDTWTQAAVIAAIITATITLLLTNLGHYLNARSARASRRREAFSKAFESYVAYREHPYQVRRRQSDDPASERRRLTEAMTSTQRELAYHRAWLRTEAPRVADRYDELISAVRRNDGRLIHDAWKADPADADADMNIEFGEARANLTEYETRFLLAGAQHLAWWPWWLHTFYRWVLGIDRREQERLTKLRQPPRHDDEDPATA